MTTGDKADMLSRLKSVIPPWFGQDTGIDTPVLNGLLTGPAASLSWFYDLFSFVKQQSRLSTMTGGWLDLFAQDFFGSDLLRKSGESDDTYRARIKAEFFRPSNTKAAILSAVAEITTASPRLIEWWRCDLTGVMDGADGAGRMFFDVDTVKVPGRMTSPGVFFEIEVSDQETRRLIFVALCRYKAQGVVIWVKFTS